MKTLYASLLSVTLGLMIAASASASPLKLIANESVTASAVSADEVKEAFLLNTPTLGGGSRIVPVIESGGPAHEAFLKEVVKKTDNALLAYYRSMVFTGKGNMPKVLASDNDVVAYVAKTKGAIGYVSADTAAPGVKTLQIK